MNELKSNKNRFVKFSGSKKATVSTHYRVSRNEICFEQIFITKWSRNDNKSYKITRISGREKNFRRMKKKLSAIKIACDVPLWISTRVLTIFFLLRWCHSTTKCFEQSTCLAERCHFFHHRYLLLSSRYQRTTRKVFLMSLCSIYLRFRWIDKVRA